MKMVLIIENSITSYMVKKMTWIKLKQVIIIKYVFSLFIIYFLMTLTEIVQYLQGGKSGEENQDDDAEEDENDDDSDEDENDDDSDEEENDDEEDDDDDGDLDDEVDESISNKKSGSEVDRTNKWRREGQKDIYVNDQIDRKKNKKKTVIHDSSSE